MIAHAALVQGGIWNVQGSITVVGVLCVALIALYLGLVTPKHIVVELRKREETLENENAALNNRVLELTQETAKLTGEVEALNLQVKYLGKEIERLVELLARGRDG